MSLNISKMTLGTVQLGMNYGIANKEGKPNQQKAFDIIEQALACDITCFDTARVYGDSEKMVGSYFKAHPNHREKICIVTKFKLGDVPNEGVESKMVESVETSLEQLQTQDIDVLLMHDAKEYLRYGKEIDRVVEKLMSTGKVKKFGASCYAMEEIKPLLNNQHFQVFQIPINLFDQHQDWKVLKDKIIFARSIYLQGLFFMDPKQLKGKLQKAAPFIRQLHNLAKETGMTVAQLAMGYVKSLDFIDSMVIGADNKLQVQQNSDLFRSAQLEVSLVEHIKKTFKDVPQWVVTPSLWDRE